MNKTTLNSQKEKHSTLSLRRVTPPSFEMRQSCHYFYPRSPCGERPICALLTARCRLFLSTLSLRRATQRRAIPINQLRISIHALLAESDVGRFRTIMIHPRFLSTLSLRRATSSCCRLLEVIYYFYPRSPCGERPASVQTRLVSMSFLSTLSLRRATCSHASHVPFYPISIHALLAESDRSNSTKLPSGGHFYPRSPCGERPAHFAKQIHSVGISIHALLAESDIETSRVCTDADGFLSTLSLRRATDCQR